MPTNSKILLAILLIAIAMTSYLFYKTPGWPMLILLVILIIALAFIGSGQMGYKRPNIAKVIEDFARSDMGMLLHFPHPRSINYVGGKPEYTYSAQPEFDPEDKEWKINLIWKHYTWPWAKGVILHTLYDPIEVNAAGPFFAYMDNDEIERRSAGQHRNWGNATVRRKSTRPTNLASSFLNFLKKRGRISDLTRMQQAAQGDSGLDV